MSAKLKRMIWELKDTQMPLKIDWIIVIAIMFFSFFSFNQADLNATATHGKDLLECIFAGKFFEFYDYTQATAVYAITIYLIFAIWSLPVFAVYKILGRTLWGVLEYGNIPYVILMWYKLLPTLFYFGTAWLLYKIALEIKLKKDTAKWVVYLYASSPIAIFSQFIFGQYDAIGLFFTMWSFYMFIKKKYYAFSIICSLAVTFKNFALFIYIPLLLLVEKRPLHIIKHGLIAIAGYVLTSLMFAGSAGYQEAMDFSGNMLSMLFSVGIGTTKGTISLFAIGLILICVIAYNKKTEAHEEYCYYAVWLALAAFACMFSFIIWHPQWVLLLIPFISLAVFLDERRNTALILHSVMALGYLGNTVQCFPNNVDTNMMAAGIFPLIFGHRPYDPLAGVFSLGGMLNAGFYLSLFVGAVIILTVYYYPLKSRTDNFAGILEEDGQQAGDRFFILLRPLMLLLFIVPAVYFFIR